MRTEELYGRNLYVKINKNASKVEKKYLRYTYYFIAKIYRYCVRRRIKKGHLFIKYSRGFTNEAEFENLSDLKQLLGQFLDIELLKYVWS